MSTTLYLLRRQPESISPSLFHVSDTDKDVVLVEHLVRKTSSGKEAVVTFDNLIERIFSSAHVIVI